MHDVAHAEHVESCCVVSLLRCRAVLCLSRSRAVNEQEEWLVAADNERVRCRDVTD